MCLIIYNPEGKVIPKNYIDNAYDSNTDGFGIMWVENGKVNIVRGMLKPDNIWSILLSLRGKQQACHFRFRTHGKTTTEQCHPHKLIKNKLYMMHNGIIDGFPNHPTKSDTMLFAKSLRKEIYSGRFDYNFLFTEEVVESFNETMGMNKLLFLDDSGRAAIVNEELGSWEDGVWFSNTYSIKKRYLPAAAVTTTVIPKTYNSVSEALADIKKEKARIIVSSDNNWNDNNWSKQKTLETFGDLASTKSTVETAGSSNLVIPEANVIQTLSTTKNNDGWTDSDNEYLKAWTKMKDERDRRRNRIMCNKKFRGE